MLCVRLLTQYNSRSVAGTKVYACEGHSDEEQVEVAVVSLGNTVPHPGTVVVKLFCEEEEGRNRGKEGGRNLIQGEREGVIEVVSD